MASEVNAVPGKYCGKVAIGGKAWTGLRLPMPSLGAMASVYLTASKKEESHHEKYCRTAFFIFPDLIRENRPKRMRQGSFQFQEQESKKGIFACY